MSGQLCEFKTGAVIVEAYSVIDVNMRLPGLSFIALERSDEKKMLICMSWFVVWY